MDKVFFSDITRNSEHEYNELYNLFKVVPALPVSVHTNKNNDCYFEHKTDKHYVPKKKSKLKVVTVRDIRNNFEKDVLCNIQKQLERHQNVLLRMIRSGSSRSNQSKVVAKNILNNDEPVTRMSWQMVMNINPHEQLHSSQFVLWNGKCIRVNGSKGGKNKFLCNRDLSGIIKEPLKNKSLKKKAYSKKKCLLRNSLALNFKPGPLTKKRELDMSYQKYNVGNVELVNLPKPGVDIQPAYGSTIDSTITNLISNFREIDGFISRKWAEFAVSVLGFVNGSKIKQAGKNIVTTFDLNYKYNQHRLLMRRDESNGETSRSIPSLINADTDEPDTIPEIQSMLNNMLDAVEISLNQDKMYSGEDEARGGLDTDSISSTSLIKDKGKRKYCELDRLDVTVIRLSENATNSNRNTCRNSHCELGCICHSLQCDINLKKHCGRIDCMFECKCEFSKYKIVDTFGCNYSEYLPGLLNLDNKLSLKLSKEEQKFHQTVIVSGDKSILLKSESRNWKTSKKYADFYSNMPLKSESVIKPVLRIVETKINCPNVEPWCMVHNLYKCFCKGKFTETLNENTLNETAKTIIDKELPDSEIISTNNANEQEGTYKTRLRKIKSIENVMDADVDNSWPDTISNECARIKPYKGRKYTQGYYSNINDKIWEMEGKDCHLRDRLLFLVNQSVINNLNTDISFTTITKSVSKSTNSELSPTIQENEDIENKKEKCTLDEKLSVDIKKDTISKEVDMNPEISVIRDSSPDITFEKTDLQMIDTSTDCRISNKPKLVAWLESSYKHYKKLLAMGVVKSTLDPPKKGKVALYPWDFILNRYKERKNLFLISKERPYRIFIGVDRSNRLFDSCISIDDIRFADLNKYPVTVKHLLTNTSDMKDHFCILFGSSICWELVGSVMKINDSKEKDTEEDDDFSDFSELVLNNVSSSTDQAKAESFKPKQSVTNISTLESEDETMQLRSSDKEDTLQVEATLPSESSKWFVMTIENDFSEIQFYNKGFFVKYESIIKAINVAKMSAKTVRLSSQKCADKMTGPQFGIYAIPTTNKDCVFVGPYETYENLGIETVKTITGCKKIKRTRGVWITTNKVDNIKVIDNPLSFMRSQNVQYNEMLPIENDSSELNTEKKTISQPSSSNNVISIKEKRKETKEKEKKVIKPIKIRKSNNFFQLTTKSVNEISVVESLPFCNWPSVVVNPSSPHKLPTTSDTAPSMVFSESLNNLPVIIATDSENENFIPTTTLSLDSLPIIIADSEIATNTIPPLFERKINANKPVAEVAPQIKITAVYSEVPSSTETESKRPERGMFILKPEEINQRLIDSKIFPKTDPSTSANVTLENNDPMDIEDFLDSSVVCRSSLDDESFLISDEDEAPIKEVWIKCRNIEKLGMIKAKIDKEERLSFEFPGFKYTEFYDKDEAFAKINQVLSRKIWIPKNLNLEWCIINSLSEVEASHMLNEEELNEDMVLTKNGLTPKTLLKISRNVKTYSRKRNSDTQSTSADDTEKVDSSVVCEEESELENENYSSWSNSDTLKKAIAKSINEASHEDREQFTNKLKDIMTQSQDV